MTRGQLIEQIWRQVSGGYPTDDSNITPSLISLYVNQGIALAVKTNYKESIQLDGIGYVNNSFYTTFKNLDIEADEQGLWKIQLPSVPLSVGRNEGVSALRFKDETGTISYDAIPLNVTQVGYSPIRPIPNKVFYYYEGNLLYVVSSMLLDQLKAYVTMISPGTGASSDAVLVPDDYVPLVIEYVSKMLNFELRQPKDAANDGIDRA